MRIEITVLGLLDESNLYGYEIKKKIVERLGDYVDIKFGSIYYAIKKAVDNGWVKRAGTEKEGGNPERYVYQILPAGKKYYRKSLKQYLDRNFIHFDIDIVLMFYNALSQEQKASFLEDRTDLLKERLNDIKAKLAEEEKKKSTENYVHLYTYLENHLKAELSWLKSLGSE